MMDFSELALYESKMVLHILKANRAWDLMVLVIEKFVFHEERKTELLNLKCNLFFAYFNLSNFKQTVEIGENILKENESHTYFSSEKEKEGVLWNTLISCLKQGIFDPLQNKRALIILKQYTLQHPSAEFKINVESMVWLRNSNFEEAINVILEGVRIKKNLSEEEYAVLYQIFMVRFSEGYKFDLTPKSHITDNKFVKIKDKKMWYYFGSDNSLDAKQYEPHKTKYNNFLGKTLHERICVVEKKYSSEEIIEEIELIYDLEQYVFWKSQVAFSDLVQTGDVDDVQSIQIVNENGVVDFDRFKSYLADIESQQSPFFDLYVEKKFPLVFLSKVEGGLLSAISKIRTKEKGFIFSDDYFSNIYNVKKEKLKSLIKSKKDLCIDGTSALFLADCGLLDKIMDKYSHIKFPNSVVNFLVEQTESLEIKDGEKGRFGYYNGEIVFLEVDKESRQKTHKYFASIIKKIQSKQINIMYISDANKEDYFLKTEIPSQFVDAYFLAEKKHISFLTDDNILYRTLEKEKGIPDYYSSQLLINVLYELGKLSVDDYISFIQYMAVHRFKNIYFNETLFLKALFNQGICDSKVIRKFMFEIYISEDYEAVADQIIDFWGRLIFKFLLNPDCKPLEFLEVFEEIMNVINLTNLSRESIENLYIYIIDERINQITLKGDYKIKQSVYEKISLLKKVKM